MTDVREWQSVDEVLAVMAGVVEYLGQPRPSVNTPGIFGNRPLKIAAVWGDPGATKLLIAAGAELDAPNEDGFTALHHAAAGGHLSVVKLLVEAGASTTVRNDENHTPPDLAQIIGGRDVATYLSELAAQPGAAADPPPAGR